MAKESHKKIKRDYDRLALRAFAGKHAVIFLIIFGVAFISDIGLLLLAFHLQNTVFIYVMIGLLLLGTASSIVMLLILFRHNTGLDERALSNMNNEIDNVASGKTTLMNLTLPSNGLANLQNRINALLEKYDHLHVIYTGRPQDKNTY